jgi:flagellar protein FlbB
MAKEKQKPPAAPAAPPLAAAPGRKRRILKILVVLLLLAILIVGGFFLGIYLRIFDTNEINEKMKLYDLPVVGQFFVKPAPNTGDETPAAQEPAAAPVTKAEPKVASASKPMVLTKAEIEKQMKAKEAAERKRVSKLARLYNEMKPQEAADIMNDLDDDMIIAILQRMDEGQSAKILAKFDPEKSARLTKIMYAGTTTRMQSPADEQAQPQPDPNQ